MVKISVVIPIFNSEKYIKQSIESVISQTFKEWEIVLVDDCSTDFSAEICKTYTEIDYRIKLYSTAENSGSAKVPRDMAISLASSEWILALDSDDFLDPDTLENLWKRKEETDADIILLRLVLTDEDGNPTKSTVPNKDFCMTQILTGRQAAAFTLNGWIINGNGLIKKEILNQRVNTHIHMNSDEYDTRHMFFLSKHVAFVDTSYYYRQLPTSITKKISHKLFDGLITNNMLIALVAENCGNNSPEYRKTLNSALSFMIYSYKMYAENKRKLSAESRRKTKSLIQSERRKFSNKQILSSDIGIVRKILFQLPHWALFSLFSIYAIINPKRTSNAA